ncbi:CAP domain-containing protein [Kribbella sp. CA-293567]|uniref:CAP domain-containing protein n=1 Tax=Kribbella sp. CA-293567 TaxID=3002436 RepID=UPI0022DCEA8E|nr:hypothetical protein [Kribbella sp. CA-293567]WBQ04195.1 hypothetical protein OX958_30035 [Kribbella sp. CA-293567]
MSTRSAAGRRRRSTRSARPRSRVRRTVVAIGSVLLVITPISWILLHQPQTGQAEASVPYVTRDDDTYLEASTTPIAAVPSAPGSTPTTASPTGTPKPSATPTPTGSPSVPGSAPSATPTSGPTTAPTAGPTNEPTAGPSGSPGTTSTPQDPASQTPDPTHSPSSTPSSSPTTTTTTPPPPTDDGSMSGAEVELFTLVDNARTERGCAPLRRDSGLTGGARGEAADRARTGDLSSGGSSGASTGGRNMTAKTAFDRLMSSNSRTVLNCGLDQLGVGQARAEYCTTQVLVCLSTAWRYAWVVDFK